MLAVNHMKHDRLQAQALGYLFTGIALMQAWETLGPRAPPQLVIKANEFLLQAFNLYIQSLDISLRQAPMEERAFYPKRRPIVDPQTYTVVSDHWLIRHPIQDHKKLLALRSYIQQHARNYGEAYLLDRKSTRLNSSH